MNLYTRVAQSTIRIFAFAVVVISVVLFASEFSYLYKFAGQVGRDLPEERPPSPPHPGRLVLEAICFLIGVVLFWKSRALAERLTRDLD